MATKSSVISKYLSIFNEIRDMTNEIVELQKVDEDDLEDGMLLEYEVFIESLEHLLSVAIDNVPYDLLDAEITAEHAEEINTRNVPVEPYNRARYVLKRMKSDRERYLKCRRYNIRHGIDVKNGKRIKYPHSMTIAEY
ncbi:MAG: hypothetical protein R3Y45_04720 [Bacillota bacterium]